MTAPLHTHRAEAERGLLSLDEARARMLEGVMPLPVEDAALDDALGLVLAESLTSRLTLPPWDNSAMDGFAVRAADVDGASRATPVRLPVTGESAAGRVSTATVEPGTAVRILTGAPLPGGADSVVPVEDTDAPMGAADLPAAVKVFAPALVGAHVRRAGGDLRVGQALLDRGTPLTPAVLALIAAAGYGRVSAHRRPRVAVLATGDELVPAGNRARAGPDRGQQLDRARCTGARDGRPGARAGHRARLARRRARSTAPRAGLGGRCRGQRRCVGRHP